MKLVRESLYNFHKTGDVKGGLNIGIRPSIIAWLDEMGIENYIINDDLTIDVLGDVNLWDKGLSEFPSFIQFDEVVGNFGFPKNELTTLEGSPKKVGGYFDCSNNKLVTLNGGPKEVLQNFYCHNNTKKFTKEEVLNYCNVKRMIIT